MLPTLDPIRWRRFLAVALVVLPLVVLGSAGAASRPRVENPHGKFREACEMCHGSEGWKPAKISSKFDHAKFGFRLEGAHAAASCLGCHTSLDFAASQTQCASCHQDPHRGEMGTDCSRCHSARSFVDRGPMVRAHQLTRFPLTGGHAALDCEGCHKPSAQGQLQFVNTQAECKSCHMDEYRSAKTPDHVGGGFPTDCQTCHAAGTWDGAKFDHQRSGFPLTGTHVTTSCESCHTGGRYKGTPKDCASCHQLDYNRAQPPHASSGFAASACATCHNTTGWAGNAFDHSTTSFPLTGAHRSTTCLSCHSDGVYNGKSVACITCHQADYDRAQPPHPASGFAASSCASCHTTTSFVGATFDHNATSFALTGAHRTTTCQSCHSDGVYNGKSGACITCHQTDYTAAVPTHSPTGFPSSACASCHNTTTWAGAVFDHNITAFPLTGAHRTTLCTSCHGDGVYKGKPMACFACHQTDYATALPPHTAAAFPSASCASCHTTTTWVGGAFNHATTAFPLTGAHRTTDCQSCHGDGVYKGKPTTCQSCHMTDYNTAVPNHPAAGFTATACASCHNTTAWSGATFNHDTQYFRIYSRGHAGRWNACTDCHTSATNFATFNCLGCHPHSNKATTDGDHRGRSGYSYTSNACYSCHTR